MEGATIGRNGPGDRSGYHFFIVTVGEFSHSNPQFFLFTGTPGPAGIEEGEQERLCLLIR